MTAAINKRRKRWVHGGFVAAVVIHTVVQWTLIRNVPLRLGSAACLLALMPVYYKCMLKLKAANRRLTEPWRYRD